MSGRYNIILLDVWMLAVRLMRVLSLEKYPWKKEEVLTSWINNLKQNACKPELPAM
jgi:hypothetical protein